MGLLGRTADASAALHEEETAASARLGKASVCPRKAGAPRRARLVQGRRLAVASPDGCFLAGKRASGAPAASPSSSHGPPIRRTRGTRCAPLTPCGRDCVRSAGTAPSRSRGPCEGSRTTLAVGSRGDARASHRRRRRAHRGCAATRRPRIPRAVCARAPARRGSALPGRDAWRRPRAARLHACPGASRGRRSRSAAPEPIVVAGRRHTPPEPPGCAATGQEAHPQPGWVATGGQRPSARCGRSMLLAAAPGSEKLAGARGDPAVAQGEP